MVGHLIGVEEAFRRSLGSAGEDPAHAIDHIGATQDAARRQAGRPVADTRAEWYECALASIEAVDAADPATTMSFYGVTLPIDLLLVVRSFEMWIHEEDVRRATRRPLAPLDPERLARMADLAVGLLPAGIARSGRTLAGRTARLVLTGPGGGTWDVNVDGAEERRPATTRVVVDATSFCRVVGDRDDIVGTNAIIDGDADVAHAVFAGAAALALD